MCVLSCLRSLICILYISFSTLILLVGSFTCKNGRPYNLCCVGADLKPCSINTVLCCVVYFTEYNIFSSVQFLLYECLSTILFFLLRIVAFCYGMFTYLFCSVFFLQFVVYWYFNFCRRTTSRWWTWAFPVYGKVVSVLCFVEMTLYVAYLSWSSVV